MTSPRTSSRGSPEDLPGYHDHDLIYTGALRDAVRKLGEEYLTWPQRELFDRIGIRRQVLEQSMRLLVEAVPQR